MLSLNDIFFVSRHELRTSTSEQIAAAQRELGTDFPDGYADVVSRFGAGEFCGELWMVLAQNVPLMRAEFSAELAASPTFWDEDYDGLDPERLSDLITLAGTKDGDLIAFLPNQSQMLYFLPRQATRVWRIASPFKNLLDWYFGGGDYGVRVPFLWFEPNKGRRRQVFYRRLSPQENTMTTMSRVRKNLPQLLPSRVRDDDWGIGFDAFFPELGAHLQGQPTSISLVCDDTATHEQTAFIEEWIGRQEYVPSAQFNL